MQPAWQPTQDDVDDTLAPAPESVAALWSRVPATQRCSQAALVRLYQFLQSEGFEPRDDVLNMLEGTRPAGPNAYQFVILQACDPEFGNLVLDHDVSTLTGGYVTETPVLALSSGTCDPAAWSADFE